MNTVIATSEVAANLITRPIMQQAINTEVINRADEDSDPELRSKYRIKHIFKNHLKRFLKLSKDIEIVDIEKTCVANAITKVVEVGISYRSFLPDPSYAFGYLQVKV